MTRHAHELLRRDVLLAVELVDPVTMTPVSKAVRLTAVGLDGAPLVNWGGRFVWLAEGDGWPDGFEFDPGQAPYEADFFVAPAPPADLPHLSAAERLLRFTLCPTVAYPFGDGLSVVRGRLHESAASNAAPIAGARVWLRWTDAGTRPRPVDAPHIARTSGHGEFAAFLRLPPLARPLIKQDMLIAQILVEHDGATRQSDLELPDGRLLDLHAALTWSALNPV